MLPLAATVATFSPDLEPSVKFLLRFEKKQIALETVVYFVQDSFFEA